jgi:Glutaredoxin-like protein
MATAKRAVAKKSVKTTVIETHHDRIDWRSLYLYAVCLITLLVVLFSVVSLINAIMNAVFPDPAYIDVYSKPENSPSADLLDQQERNNQIRASRVFSPHLLLLPWLRLCISITGARLRNHKSPTNHQKVNSMSFVMYSTSWCGYCKRLKSQLAEVGITFEEINIEEVPGTAEIVEKVNGGNRTVPTLVFSDGAAMTNPSAKQVVEKLAELGL